MIAIISGENWLDACLEQLLGVFREISVVFIQNVKSYLFNLTEEYMDVCFYDMLLMLLLLLIRILPL